MPPGLDPFYQDTDPAQAVSQSGRLGPTVNDQDCLRTVVDDLSVDGLSDVPGIWFAPC